MSLKPFTYPFPETRFLHSGSSVYKFKIRYGNSIRGEDTENKEVIVQELEDSIRVVLGNLDNLQPFATEHFIVFPYKSKWERVSHLKFKHGDIILVPYPFVLTLYIEKKRFRGNLTPGKPVNDKPLGLEESQASGSSVKVPAERKEAGVKRRKRKHVEVSSSPSRPGLDRAEARTCSHDSSKKKLLKETGKNGEGRTQQECQATPAFDVDDVHEQDSRAEAGPAGQGVLPLHQNGPPAPKAPAGLGARGFFGFLSSLFPFRYFFGKSRQ